MLTFQHILNNILSIIIWLPIVTGILVLLINKKQTGYLAVLIGGVNLFLSCLMLKNFNIVGHGWQFIEHYQWLPNLGIYYALGVDGFSILLIVLASVVNLLVLIISLQPTPNRSKYMACFLIMNGLINGVFAATNAILFYMFFESMLIPLFLIIGIWGGQQRVYATIKFFLYTCLGSMLFLIAIIYLHKTAINSGFSLEQSFVIQNFYLLTLTIKQQVYLFVALFIAFAIKIPIVPFHTWLPDAHVEAPTEGSVVLAAITLKIGAFAMIRFLLPIVTDACLLLSKFVIWGSLFTIVYIGFITVAQKNLKKLIAYSSISHMGFITMGLFIAINLVQRDQDINLAILSMNGSIIQMISHGLISAALFFSIGALYKRVGSYNLEDFSGIIHSMPIFTKLFMVFCLANVALPGTIGFAGELLIILASFKVSYLLAVMASTSLILSVVYTLCMYKKVVFGELDHDGHNHSKILTDLNYKETLVLGGSAILILLLGIWPAPMLNILNNSTLDFIRAIS
ncbi:MAG: NADH-quinone oxidoreductase subunit M [Gammaproteobacteria bacterium]|jgi:NADH-quinone oxidoreductase subunit M